MILSEAIDRACAEVGIEAPRGRVDMHRWINTDTLGKNGRGDGRLICDEQRVTAFNWQTGSKATVWLEGRKRVSLADRQRYAREAAEAERRGSERVAEAAREASLVTSAATAGTHPYLARKGFPEEPALVLAKDRLIDILEVARKRVDSLVTDGGKLALVVPARAGRAIQSVQIIWEDGTKKFLAGGAMQGATHRVAKGRETWLCEGLATALSLRTALKGLGRSDTVLVCFSAANMAKVASASSGRCFVAADNDKPLEQFGGRGAGEHYARLTARPYIMPADVGMDINDLHQGRSVFAVQTLITDLLRRAA